MSVELKPCPLCGGEAVLFKIAAINEENDFEAYYIVCQECGLQNGMECEMPKVIAMWDRR